MARHALILAGTHSGVGKTTVSLALMAALRQRGLAVQPFKVGPDFIDPGHHTAVCGRVSRNLDTWMLSPDQVRTTFARASADADVVIIEGVMGLFDGRGAADWRGSTADLAKLLDLPVVLVLDASAMAASVAAIVKGFSELDPQVRVAGVICNRVAGPRHYDYLEPAIRRHTRAAPLGWLPRDAAWSIPERHLGLMTAEEVVIDARTLANRLADSVDIESLLSLASRERQPPEDETSFLRGLTPPARQSKRRIAVARDAAFCFYYVDNLDLLVEGGGEIVPFSPLNDAAMPAGIDLLYLGGGYPELHAEQLSANTAMLDSIRRYHASGGRLYAECGGLMACCRELIDQAGRAWPMLDLLPARTVMQSRRAALGYVTLRTTKPSLLGPPGSEVRGHEFHYSRLEALGPLEYAAELEDSRGERRPDGLISANLWAGYAHLHFASSPAMLAEMGGRG